MPKVSEAHLQARRQQILDAAATCFARDGFHRTSMQDIVRECGVSAGLVYRYFASKDEMIAEIVRDWHAHRASAMTARPGAEGYLELLREIGTVEAPDARLALQVWAETARSDELRSLARDGVRFATELPVPAGALPEGVDAAALMRVLVAVYQGLLVQTAWDEGLDNAAFVDVVEDILRRLTP